MKRDKLIGKLKDDLEGYISNKQSGSGVPYLDLIRSNDQLLWKVNRCLDDDFIGKQLPIKTSRSDSDGYRNTFEAVKSMIDTRVEEFLKNKSASIIQSLPSAVPAPLEPTMAEEKKKPRAAWQGPTPLEPPNGVAEPNEIVWKKSGSNYTKEEKQEELPPSFKGDLVLKDEVSENKPISPTPAFSSGTLVNQRSARQARLQLLGLNRILKGVSKVGQMLSPNRASLQEKRAQLEKKKHNMMATKVKRDKIKFKKLFGPPEDLKKHQKRDIWRVKCNSAGELATVFYEYKGANNHFYGAATRNRDTAFSFKTVSIETLLGEYGNTESAEDLLQNGRFDFNGKLTVFESEMRSSPKFVQGMDGSEQAIASEVNKRLKKTGNNTLQQHRGAVLGIARQSEQDRGQTAAAINSNQKSDIAIVEATEGKSTSEQRNEFSKLSKTWKVYKSTHGSEHQDIGANSTRAVGTGFNEAGNASLRQLSKSTQRSFRGTPPRLGKKTSRLGKR